MGYWEPLILVLVLVFGLILGSFLNVVIYRVPRGESIVFPGSHCPECGHGLGPLDLVPVLSYIVLRGRCRYCGARISPRYPLVELLTGCLFALVYLASGWSVATLAGFILVSILIVAAMTDIDCGIIPDRVTYPGMVLGLAYALYRGQIKGALIGVAIFAGILLIAAIASRGGMGGGDVKLAAVIGAFTLADGAFLAFVLSSLIGSLWACYLLATGQARRSSTIRFGPFLALAGVISFLYKHQIISWYLHLF